MKKIIFLLSLVILTACSSTRNDHSAYYHNYFSNASLENTTVPVTNDTSVAVTDLTNYSSGSNYSDWGSNPSTINVNYYNTNLYWSNNIYTNHWPYTNYVYSNDYYGYYWPYANSYYIGWYPTYYYNNYNNNWYHPHYYHPHYYNGYHNYGLGNVYSNGWVHRNNVPRTYTSTYAPRNYSNSSNNQPRNIYTQTPRNNYNNNNYNTPRSYNNTPTYNTPRSYNNSPTPRSYNNSPTPRSYTPSNGGYSGGGRSTGGGRR